MCMDFVKYDLCLYKGLEHLQISVSVGGPEPIPLGYQDMNMFIFLWTYVRGRHLVCSLAWDACIHDGSAGFDSTSKPASLMQSWEAADDGPLNPHGKSWCMSAYMISIFQRVRPGGGKICAFQATEWGTIAIFLNLPLDFGNSTLAKCCLKFPV